MSEEKAEKPMSVHLADKAKLLLKQICDRQFANDIDEAVDTIIQASVMRLAEFQRMAQVTQRQPTPPPMSGFNRAGKPTPEQPELFNKPKAVRKKHDHMDMCCRHECAFSDSECPITNGKHHQRNTCFKLRCGAGKAPYTRRRRIEK